MSDHCKIVELRASNVKRIKAVTIRPDPDGTMVVVSGNNGHGKSSVLDAISMVFGGKDQMPGTPVRVGEDIAEIVADIGEMVITRRISSTGHTTLKVQNHEGATFSSPQRMLDALTGKLTFDPLSFSRMKAKDQAELLRELLGLDFLDQMRERQGYYDQRTDANRGVKQAEATLALMPKEPDDLPERVSVAELLIKLNAAEATNRDFDEHTRNMENARKNLVNINMERARLREQLEKLNAEHTQTLKDITVLEEGPARVDVVPITEAIAGAENINAQHQEAEQRKVAETTLRQRVEASADMTKKIKAIDKARLASIAAADMPVEGLGFNDDGLVTLNGLTLEQASAAEQLRVSVAIGIAMNPKLRVLLVRDASLLDDKSMALVAQLAKDSDCQLWVERIEVDSNTTVIIEEGELKQ
jgi:ABC-type cobalamin/Fe3+-siderophores transport system ATPase subunit